MNSNALHIGAVLLAAGNASRFGAAKQVLPIEGTPMVTRAAKSALDAGLSPVIVVTGAYGDAVKQSLANLPVQLAENVDWASGMGASLAVGVRAARANGLLLRALLVLLADQPGVGAMDLHSLVEAYALSPERIRAARYGGHLGPPCLFPSAYFDELASLDGPYGARGMLERHADFVDAHDLPSAAFDIDTPPDFAAWDASHG